MSPASYIIITSCTMQPVEQILGRRRSFGVDRTQAPRPPHPNSVVPPARWRRGCDRVIALYSNTGTPLSHSSSTRQVMRTPVCEWTRNDDTWLGWNSGCLLIIFGRNVQQQNNAFIAWHLVVNKTNFATGYGWSLVCQAITKSIS